MSSNRFEKKQDKKRSFDLKTRDRVQEEQNDEEFRHKTHKQMRRQRRNYDTDLTDEEHERLKIFLQEYSGLSDFRIKYKIGAFTVPDFQFFIKSPEEFLRNRPRFGDVFESRSRRNRWIKALVSRELGADQVNKFLDGLDDDFLEKFGKLKNNCQFDTFVAEENTDLKTQLTNWVSTQIE